MIVTFKTRAYSNITMFGDVAVHLLKMMGQTGNVPGAIKDDDVSQAHETLKQALDRLPEDKSIDQNQAQDADNHPQNKNGYDDKDDEEQRRIAVSLKQRAGPLLDLLAAAAKNNTYVSWE